MCLPAPLVGFIPIEQVFLIWQQAMLAQWCAQDNSCTEGRTQRYREAPAKIEKAVDHWLAGTAELSFVLSLGDIINGNSNKPVTLLSSPHSDQSLHVPTDQTLNCALCVHVG